MRLEETISFRIEEVYASLRTSEKRTADYVLGSLDRVGKMSLTDLSKNAGVSQPTILRFVKALGFQGFREFKYAVVEEMAQDVKAPGDGIFAMYGYRLNAADSVDKVPAKTIATTIKVMENTLKCISTTKYSQVVDLIAKADVIDVYGVENSGTTVSDLYTKLLYLGLKCRSFNDYYLQRICASNLTKKDVAIGISYSGCSKDTVDVMRIAKKSGAKTIVITNFENALISKYADITLCTTHEQLLYGDAIFSRASQLALVDMIYLGIILSDYDKYARQLDKSGRIIRDKAYDS